MYSSLKNVISSTDNKKNLYKPEFYRLINNQDRALFLALIEQKPYLRIFDKIQSQLEELVKCLNPKIVYSRSDLAAAAHEYLGKRTPEEYGVWVYYPWSDTVVHLLDEEEFVRVRTNRNQYKITPHERDLLAEKRTGIIGLSVGQSVALTMAMERSFGELRIADFDNLELSNLNRIRSGVHNFMVPKVICVAREIAEIDPYLKVTCFFEGISEANLEQFMTEGGKLDLLIEECDSLYIKVIARQKARELKIPVVMDTSDKGMLDIERFDLEPDRPILHGLINHLDTSVLKDLKTNEEKVPYVLPIIGIETISKRMKASMLEIEQSITTWPQLSSAVTLGGGITADVSRRILLGQLHVSGRFFVDIEDLISDPDAKKESISVLQPSVPPLREEDLDHMLAELPEEQIPEQTVPDLSFIKEITESGIMAPSAGNNQPWKFRFRKGKLYLFHDKHYSESFGDYEDMASMIGHGAVIENIVLKTHEHLLEVRVDYFPDSRNRTLVAAFSFFTTPQGNTEPHILNDLATYIPLRFTNRNYGQRTEIPERVFEEFRKSVIPMEGADVQFLKDEKLLTEIGEIISSADKLRFMNFQAHYEFFDREVRWTRDENQKYRDGLDMDTFDLTVAERAALGVASDPEVISYLRKWKGGDGFKRMSLKAVKSSGSVGLITMPKADPLNYIKGGRAAQRLWLTATKEKISIQPLFSPPLFFARLLRGKGSGMDEQMKDELGILRQRYKKIFNITDDTAEVFLFRICQCREPEIKSLRKPLSHFLNA